MKRFIQLAAGFKPADAVSAEILRMKAIGGRHGFETAVVCEPARAHPAWRDRIWSPAEALERVRVDDLVLLHLSTGSPVNELFADLPGRKVLRYHNITPAHYFAGYPGAGLLVQGRRQMRELADVADLNLAVSRFNAAELEENGYRDVRVLPLMWEPRMREAPAKDVLERFSDGKLNLVFVGRGAPNKRIEDALSVFYYLQRFVRPDSRFIHAGSFAGTEKYHALLFAYARQLELRDIELMGRIPDAELAAVYRCASVFICMSEHEGFCAPLIEAMAAEVPVLAYDAGAVAETLGGAGVLFHEKPFDIMAETIQRLSLDPVAREAILGGQRRKLEMLRTQHAEQAFADLIFI